MASKTLLLLALLLPTGCTTVTVLHDEADPPITAAQERAARTCDRKLLLGMLIAAPATKDPVGQVVAATAGVAEAARVCDP